MYKHIQTHFLSLNSHAHICTHPHQYFHESTSQSVRQGVLARASMKALVRVCVYVCVAVTRRKVCLDVWQAWRADIARFFLLRSTASSLYIHSPLTGILWGEVKELPLQR